MLTSSELKQIKDYLALYGKKDSQLEAIDVDWNYPEYTFEADDYLSVVQDAKNKTITIKDLEKVFLLTFLTDEDFREALEGKIPGEMLENACVTTEKLADGTITTIKIGDRAVTTDKIEDYDSTNPSPTGVTTSKIADGAITADKLSGYAVTEGKIANGAVTHEKLAPESVTAGTIATGAVRHENLTEECVLEGNIGNYAVQNTNLSGSYNEETHTWTTLPAVSERTIATGAVTEDKLSGNMIDGEWDTPPCVTTDKIADYNVTTIKIADRNVTTAKLQDYDPEATVPTGVTTQKIADGAVTTAKIVDNSITTNKLANSSVSTAKIVDEAITEDKLADGAVTTAKLADGLISEIQNITDATPTTGSVKPVQSGGVKTAIDNVAFSTNEKVNTVGIDDEPVLASHNLISSDGVAKAINGIDYILGQIEKETATDDNNEVIISTDDGRQVFSAVVDEENTTLDEEEVWSNDNETDVYARVNSQGICAKKFFTLDGEEIAPNNLLANKTIDFEGDSITKANDDNNIGFCRAAQTLSMNYTNNGVSGATVSVYPNKTSIYTLVTTRQELFDYTIIQLSTVNDTSFSERKGSLTSEYTKYKEEGSIDDFNVETYYGALEALARYCILHLNKVGWIIPYRVGISMGDSNIEKPTCIRSVAKKWGIPILDLNNNAGFNLCNDGMSARYGAYTGNVQEYVPTEGYTEDEEVRYNNKTYKADSAIPAPAGAFDVTKWTEISDTNYDTVHCNTDGYKLIENKLIEFIKSL